MVIFLVTLLTLLFAAWLMSEPVRTELRRARVRRQPFPHAWREILKKRVPLFRTLPADLQLQLKKHIQVFIAEKAFIGCKGLEVTDDMRVTVAAQACLLLLNRRTNFFPSLRQILMYPGAFVVNRSHTDDSGVQQDQRHALLGESWSQGQVILSWEDAAQGAAIADDGLNVVIHEFAHQLDTENGEANGFPKLARASHVKRWTTVMSDEFARLQAAVQHREPTLLNRYGATSPAEFFAVASETFFEQPLQLVQEHPALYEELSRLYHYNPLTW